MVFIHSLFKVSFVPLEAGQGVDVEAFELSSGSFLIIEFLPDRSTYGRVAELWFLTTEVSQTLWLYMKRCTTIKTADCAPTACRVHLTRPQKALMLTQEDASDLQPDTLSLKTAF